MNEDKFNEIRQLINDNDVVLFMKGNADSPNCGFSATVVHILRKLNTPFKDINILADEALRQAIKEFSDWPTIPQLYIKGEFIGGCDITKEMYSSGELETLLKAKNIIS